MQKLSQNFGTKSRGTMNWRTHQIADEQRKKNPLFSETEQGIFS